MPKYLKLKKMATKKAATPAKTTTKKAAAPKAAATKATKPAVKAETVKAKVKSAEKKVVSKVQNIEELIRRRAEEIYHARVAKGEHGTPESDWIKAEKEVKASKKK